MNVNELADEVIEYVDDMSRNYLKGTVYEDPMSRDHRSMQLAYSFGTLQGMLDMIFTEMSEEGRERVSNKLKIFRHAREKKR